ncbi:hypothetical protein [Streptomyces sp. RK75]|uniref:hypothetical protein n=1 Tax=Streptomyces sp. RK75 TaxID=2824895 RepID=UPI001B3901CD|nr:hypothetical protein [Streptomyces sp. RK75]MBQ0864058.1 hypothetical protein [Streptomyces sp. RK75]
MRRIALDRVVHDAGGEELPDDTNEYDHLSQIFDECNAIAPHILFTPNHDGNAAQTTLREGEREYAEITFDPGYSIDKFTADVYFRTACVLHEIMHVIVSRKYHRPANLSPEDRLINFHFGNDADVRRQSANVVANFEKAIRIADSDPKVRDRPLHDHLFGRLEYGLVTPHVHNETVVLDLLVYMKLQGFDKNATYMYLTSLSEEAMERRAMAGEVRRV